MKATPKLYARPEKAPLIEVVPIVSLSYKSSVHSIGDTTGILLRLMAVGGHDGEIHIRMSNQEALSVAAEIVLKVARKNGL